MHSESLSGPEVLRAILAALAIDGRSGNFILKTEERESGGVSQKITSSASDVHNPPTLGLLTYRSYVIKAYGGKTWMFSLGQGVAHPAYCLQTNLIGIQSNIPSPDHMEESARKMIGRELSFTLLVASTSGLITTINEFEPHFQLYQQLRDHLAVPLGNRLAEFMLKLPAPESLRYTPDIVPWLTRLVEAELEGF